MSRFLFFALLPLLILLSRCAESGEVEDSFHSITNLHTSDDRSGIRDYFDEDTHRYIDEIVEAAGARNLTRAQRIGQEFEVPIGTMIIYHAIATPEGSPDSSNYASKELAWLFLMLDGTGVFRHSKDLPIRILDGARVSGNTATLSVSVSSGNGPRLGTSYLFRKAGDAWKLNFPSTMKLIEKIHDQNQRSSGIGFSEYALRLSQQKSDQIEFRARQIR